MRRLRAICDDYDMLLIYDEVMTGFGRTGEWFAAYHWDVEPDIMTLSKAINNGALPLGAVMISEKLASFFEDKFLYAGLTQFGNPVACAAAVAAIKIYDQEGLIENSKKLGLHLLEQLDIIKQKHPSVGDVRGLGLFAAIELVKDKQTKEPIAPWTVEFYENKHSVMKKLVATLKESGLYTYTRWNILFICPPLCITQDELTWGLARIDEALTLVDNAIGNAKGSLSHN